MRIQHNIMAMSAYRNYNNNTSALSKNLEKLSSGYKINRAGDDAAGLAISEKMRAQITGLDAAQKNVKDGISLVKTAEGAMQEVQDMLNRMDYLATQSANGTYDNDVDRAALQKEVNQLNAEINRIADSANFNGIKLLDGSLDADGRRANTTTVFAGSKMANNVHGFDPTTGAANPGANGSSNAKGGIKISGAYSGDTAGAVDRSDKSARYHKDAAESSKTSFTISLDGFKYEASAGTTVKDLEFALQGGTATAGMGTGNHLVLDNDGTDTKLKYSVIAGSEGVTSEDIASAIEKVVNDNGGKVYIKTGTVGTGAQPAYIEYSVTRDGDKLTFTMTDDGYDTAYKADTANTKADGTKTVETANYFQGNFNFSLAYKQDVANNTPGADENKKLQNAFAAAANDKLVGNTSTSVVNEGSSPAGTIYAQAYIRFTKDGTGDTNKTTDFIKDGAGLQLGDEYYIFAASDVVYNTEYADNVKVVDIRDLKNLNTTKEAAGSQEYYDDLRVALDRLSVAAKDNEMFDVQVEESGAILAINERTTYTGGANLTEKGWGLESQIQKFDSASSTTTVTREAGKALTLQIGDTSDKFNQLELSIGDIHTDALGVDKVNVGNQEDAAAAIEVIKNAINRVSTIRGDLGATQNRLEHTGNNLAVMAENIQDAESTIRDTDVANEMMSYVKNNILVQSAQAMLAQANQVPQGVLQLLG